MSYTMVRSEMHSSILLLFLFLAAATASGFTPSACGQCPSEYPAPCLQFYGPGANATRAQWSEWLVNISSWRLGQIAKFSLSEGHYHIPQLNWTQTSFVAPQVHPYDRYLYNRTTRSYTVDRFLLDLTQRYGGIDALLLWPTYPNIGVDDRSQFDLLRSMPGGTAGLADLVSQFHQRGIHVLFPYNPWDVGTRRETVPDPQAVTSLLQETGADGINGDTMVVVPKSFWTAAVAAGLDGIAIEPEIGGLPEAMNWTLLGWGEGWNYPTEPCVDADRWVMRRRMTHVCNRWAKDKTDDIQNALINGVGYVSWENVWGTWNGITARGGELIRRYAALMRFFRPGVRLDGESWRPLTPCLLSSVFASSWDGTPSDYIFRVYFLVNRGASNASGSAFLVDDFPAGGSVYDCYSGVQVDTTRMEPAGGGDVYLPAHVDAADIGCLAILKPSGGGPTSAEWLSFMSTMALLTKEPLASFSNEWSYLPQVLEGHYDSEARTSLAAPAPGMVRVPGCTSFEYHSKGIEIEGPPGYGVDFQFPWESHPRREHKSVVSIPPLMVDERLVTNADWLAYINASGYEPVDPLNYLRFWTSPQSFPPGSSDAPVTWISYDEAKTYCAYYGKRLPYPWEWQYFAGNGSAFPWGDASTPPSGALPNTSSTESMPMPPSVHCCPSGASPFGILNTFQFVWQWTSVFTDLHTRAALLVGGSYYRPQGSGWYMRHPASLLEHNKLLTMDDSYDRSGAIGFRCVADAPEQL